MATQTDITSFFQSKKKVVGLDGAKRFLKFNTDGEVSKSNVTVSKLASMLTKERKRSESPDSFDSRKIKRQRIAKRKYKTLISKTDARIKGHSTEVKIKSSDENTSDLLDGSAKVQTENDISSEENSVQEIPSKVQGNYTEHLKDVENTTVDNSPLKTAKNIIPATNIPVTPTKKLLQNSMTGLAKLSKFEPITFEVKSPKKNVSSPRKVPASPTKSPIKSCSLALPFKYRFLEELFHNIDTVVSMLHNRKETITWEKLKSSVQKMMRRTITERHIGQICRVFPEAYKLQYDKTSDQMMAMNNKSDKFTLTFVPTFHYTKSDSQFSTHHLLTPVRLLERRNIFHRNLIHRVKDAHEKFLNSLEIPVKVCKKDLTQWHPLFELEEVVDVEPLQLPQPPSLRVFTSAKDVLENACINNQRVKKALEDAQNAEKVLMDAKVRTVNSEPKKVKVPPALKGISPALLAKIREREAAKLARELTRPVEDERKLERLSKLPHIVRILRSTFISEKKTSLPLQRVIDLLSNSQGSCSSEVEIEELLKLLVKHVPNWLEIHTLSSGKFVKLNKDMELSTVNEKLNSLIKELQ